MEFRTAILYKTILIQAIKANTTSLTFIQDDSKCMVQSLRVCTVHVCIGIMYRIKIQTPEDQFGPFFDSKIPILSNHVNSIGNFHYYSFLFRINGTKSSY